MNQEIFESVDNYVSGLFGDQDDVLIATERSIIEANIPQISVSPNQGKFLHVLARLCKASRILEIGTLAGYSTIWLARALPSTGRLISLELDPNHASVARKNIIRAGLDSVVEIRVGKALDSLAQIKAENMAPFDMIFIDADKPPYAEYFQWALRLSKSGTLIVADNVIRDGKVLDKTNSDPMVQGAQRFNELLASHPGVTATIFQTVGAKEHDGMAIAVVK